MRRLVVLLALAGTLAVAPSAAAGDLHDDEGGGVTCLRIDVDGNGNPVSPYWICVRR